jgi:tol-pal system protein YbgF
MTSMKPLMAVAAVVFVLAAPAPGQAAKWSLFGSHADEAAPLPPAASDSVDVAQAGDGDRMARIEGSMRNLTGQIEELTFQLKQLQDQMKRLQEDTDFRLRDLEGAGAPAQARQSANAGQSAAQPRLLPGAGAPVGGAAVAVDEPPVDMGEPASADATDAPPPGAQPLDLSTLATGDGTIGLQTTQGLPPAQGLPAGSAAVQPPPLQAPGAAAAQAPRQQVAAIASSGDPRTDYDQAYALIRSGQYDLAESSFRQFLVTYPGDELAPEAQYWLGESLFARGDYGAAAEEFKKGYKAYPKSKRGPDTLLKLGLSMAGLDFRDEACKMYALALKQYPDMSNGLRQRVKNEQASAAC